MPYNSGNNRYSRSKRRPSAGGGASRSYGGGSRRPARKGPKKDYIAPERFIKAAKQVKKEEYIPQNQFKDFTLHPTIHQQITRKGFETPSPIQDQVIPHAVEGKDIIGLANTGTGKTMAFGIPVIQKLMTDRRARAIIMAPTRELAEQVLDEIRSITSRESRIYWTLLIGGAPMGRQLRDLSRNPRLIVGTPGRIQDHIERGSLDLSDIDTVVLDEVDRMLDMGFVNSIRRILENAPTQDRQSLFFSATMDPKVRTIIDDFTNDAMTVSVVSGSTTDTVEQDVVYYDHDDDKLVKLREQLADGNRKVLIFDDTRRQVEKLVRSLNNEGFASESIHGGKNQSQRRRALNKFKENHINILVATDVAARGIDVDGITHVINYSTPQTYSDYTHRIGRAGRAGNTGYALTFLEAAAQGRRY